MTTIIDAMNDPELMGKSFSGPSWDTWRAVLSAAFAMQLTDAQAETFRKVSGGRERPLKRVNELWAIAGRRSAKTHIASAVTVYLATIGSAHQLTRLAPGERAVVALIATDRQQAKVALGYVQGLLESSPLLAGMIERMDSDTIDLTNRVSIQVQTASYRTIRGRTLIACVFDEASFWRDQSAANPAKEIYRAAVPALATTGGMLIGISSPYSKSGLVFDKYRKSFGKNSDVLVVQGATSDFNPTLDPRVIDRAIAEDPEAAKSEWLGQFRNDISAFISREIAEACIDRGVFERGRLDATHYFGFVDPSGGSQDSMTMAIAHQEGNKAVIDLVREIRPPFSPEQAVSEFSDTLKAYGIRSVQGDRYAGEWPREQFQKQGITYMASAKPKSDLYRDLLPKLNSGQIALIDNDRMLGQLLGLERRTARGGRDSIDHGPGQHDDLINSVAGVAAMAAPQQMGKACFGVYGNQPAVERGYYQAESQTSRLAGTAGQPDPQPVSYQLSDGSFFHQR